MSIYGDAPGVEKSAAVPAAATAEPELVVPDYAPPTTAAAVASTMGAAGASAPAVQFLRKYGLNEAPIGDSREAQELADFQTIMYNISLGLILIIVIHFVAVMIFLDDEMDSFMYFAYIVAGLAACGYFGAKHHDKSQLAIYVISTAVCTLFIGLTTVILLYSWASTSDPSAAELQACSYDPECNPKDLEAEAQHPISEGLPDLALTILLFLGCFCGYKMYSHPTTDTAARPIQV